MPKYLATWYELSGLPTYGLDRTTGAFARRGYVLYRGVDKNLVQRSQWRPLGTLPAGLLAHVVERIDAGVWCDDVLEAEAVRQGTLRRVINYTGTPVTEFVTQPKEECV